jgi:hypothetical protein
LRTLVSMLVALVLVALAAGEANAAEGTSEAAVAAEVAPSCTAGPADDPFPTCFDAGNRLYLQLAYGGVGGGVALRHTVHTEDKDIDWRLEHRLSEAAYDGSSWRGALYQGRFARHSRDGHIMLPLSPPKKLFLPFDIGGEADFLSFVATPGQTEVTFGLVRAALLFDLARADDFSRRFVFGIASRWDVIAPDLHRPFSVAEHFAAPFSLGVAGLHLESQDGPGFLGPSILDVSVEAGERWSSQNGWAPAVTAAASVELVVVALNDRPLSLYCQTGWEAPGRGAWLTAGVRFGLGRLRSTPPGR